MHCSRRGGASQQLQAASAHCCEHILLCTDRSVRNESIVTL